jgi:4'-phosphopantetheinyl transferase
MDTALARPYAALLSADEQTRWQRFARAADRQRFLLSRALLRTVLGDYLSLEPRELRFVSDEWGKPHLSAEPSLHFNLSHTQGMVALAVSRRAPVGVDVENMERVVDAEALTARYFAPEELFALQTLPPNARRAHFLRLWTLKEAYVKALGLGLRIPLDSFAFAPHGDAINVLRREDKGAHEPVTLRSLCLPSRHQLGLALLAAGELELRIFQGLPLQGFTPLALDDFR